MEIKTLIDAYIDVNILLALSLGIWLIARRIMDALGLRNDFTTQLRLLNGVFLATIFSPILVAIGGLLITSGAFTTTYSVNISDFVTAQYLNGSFAMAPGAFEEALGFRGRLLSGMQYLDTNLGVVLVTFMLSGFALAMLRLGLGFRRLCQIVSASTVWRQFGTLELRVSDTTAIPFSTRSLRRRIIVIPSSMLANPEDLKIALSHEFQHFRQHDLEWEIGLELLKPFFFWNPAYTLWKRKFEALRELSCDQNLLTRGRIDVGDYCQSLLRVCENGLKPVRLFAVEVPRVTLAETRVSIFNRTSAGLLRHRLDSLLDGSFEQRPRTVFAFFIIPLITITLVGSMAIQKPDDWSHDRLMLSTIVNLERLAARNDIAATFALNER